MTQATSDQGGGLAALLTCPADRTPLELAGQGHRCTRCLRIYAVSSEIPILLADEGLAAHDEVAEHSHGAPEHKHAQAAFFDDASAAEFEITRPHGTPALYAWMLEEKLRRSVRGIESMLPGSTVLVVCGGSGMDAEFMALRGASVLSVDISLGASQRTAERAQRYNLDITPIVADAEHLPFADRSIDIVTVHDGLHHLEHPMAALQEMVRVTGRAISISEPAEAAVTRLAIKLGLARDREEAGNRVMRLQLDEVSDLLQRQGFAVVLSQRYAVYYRHVPGRLVGLLSRPVILPVVKFGLQVGDRLMGRFGNKLAVVATRLG